MALRLTLKMSGSYPRGCRKSTCVQSKRLQGSSRRLPITEGHVVEEQDTTKTDYIGCGLIVLATVLVVTLVVVNVGRAIF